MRPASAPPIGKEVCTLPTPRGASRCVTRASIRRYVSTGPDNIRSGLFGRTCAQGWWFSHRHLSSRATFEPYRGFPQALEAAREGCATASRCAVRFQSAEMAPALVCRRPAAGAWKDHRAFEILDIPRENILFPGVVPAFRILRQLFQISAAHLYYDLSVRFVFGQVLEAMACGALVIRSDTAPVREVIRAGRNGLLVPFFDADALAEVILGALKDPERHLGVLGRGAPDGRASFPTDRTASNANRICFLKNFEREISSPSRFSAIMTYYF